MIRKNVRRFSEKIMRKEGTEAMTTSPHIIALQALRRRPLTAASSFASIGRRAGRIFVADICQGIRTLPISGRQSVLCASYDDIAVRFLRRRAGDAVQVFLLESRKLRVINAPCRLTAMMDEAAGTLAMPEGKGASHEQKCTLCNHLPDRDGLRRRRSHALGHRRNQQRTSGAPGLRHSAKRIYATHCEPRSCGTLA
jgi:hypothetical protein